MIINLILHSICGRKILLINIISEKISHLLLTATRNLLKLFRFLQPLRFRKAGRVWCRGARETQ